MGTGLDAEARGCATSRLPARGAVRAGVAGQLVASVECVPLATNGHQGDLALAIRAPSRAGGDAVM